MSKLSTFNEHFQKTLTLRNELVPVGKTLENIISSNVLINDEKRSEDYKKAKCLPPVTWPPCATNADTSGQVEVGSYADT